MTVCKVVSRFYLLARVTIAWLGRVSVLYLPLPYLSSSGRPGIFLPSFLLLPCLPHLARFMHVYTKVRCYDRGLDTPLLSAWMVNRLFESVRLYLGCHHPISLTPVRAWYSEALTRREGTSRLIVGLAVRGGAGIRCASSWQMEILECEGR